MFGHMRLLLLLLMLHCCLLTTRVDSRRRHDAIYFSHYSLSLTFLSCFQLLISHFSLSILHELIISTIFSSSFAFYLYYFFAVCCFFNSLLCVCMRTCACSRLQLHHSSHLTFFCIFIDIYLFFLYFFLFVLFSLSLFLLLLFICYIEKKKRFY